MIRVSRKDRRYWRFYRLFQKACKRFSFMRSKGPVEKLELDRDAKVLAIAAWIKNLVSDIDQLDKEMPNLV